MKPSGNFTSPPYLTWVTKEAVPAVLWLGVVMVLGACSGTPPKTPSSRGAGNGALVWSFERDKSGRLVGTTDPGDQPTTCTYSLHPNGQIRQVIRETPGGTRAEQEFDDKGRPVRNALDHSETSFSYDSMSRLASVRREGLPQLFLSYDTLDRPKSMKIGSIEIGSKYDILGRMSSVSTPWGTIKYTYSAAEGLVIRTLPTGTRSAWKLDIHGQPVLIEHSDAKGHVIVRFTYERRPDGRVRSVREESPSSSRVISYEYDALGQLLAASDSIGGKTSFQYDGLANRTAVVGSDGKEITSSHDFAGRLTRLGTGTCEHDGSANLLGCVADGRRFVHDSTGSLSKVTNGSTTVEYRYDATGLLIGRRAAGRDEMFLADPTADGWHPLFSKDSTGNETVYLWDGALPLGIVTGGKPRFFLHDNLGSVRVLVDDKGDVVERRDYEPFGEPRDGPRTSLVAGFAGIFYDADAKLYVTRSRAYDPQQGRFLERDPEIRIPGISAEDLSAYSYCGNDPINSVDASGSKQTGTPLYEQYKKISYVRIPKRDFTQYGLTSTPGFKPGRHGTENTRLHNHLVALELQRKGWTITHMGGGWRDDAGKLTGELRLPPMPGVEGAEGANYLDIVAVKGDRLLLINTYSHRNGETLEGPQDDSVKAKVAEYLKSSSGPPRPSSPSNVGGVALAGMGAALEGIGQLQGVALDENGRIVLIAKDATSARLPSMQLDDVATVFRSVYEYSEAPLVSIDPDPKNPRGAAFLIRHGAATAGTYVGWVLFEADRVMKAYSLGKDNISGDPVHTRIPGYQNLVDTASPGATLPPGKAVWERFWIVPGQRTETSAPKASALTLLDVALQVNTQVMTLSAGKLVPATKGQPSPDAKSFADWFTRNYAALEKEVVSRLPAGHGRTFDKVNVFAELRRIALLTAVAEKARDDGVPFPAWIRSRKVAPFPMPTTTPRLVIERRLDGSTLTVGGGVSLVTPNEAVKRNSLPSVATMMQGVATILPASAAVSPMNVSLPNGPARVVALPGAETQDVGAVVLEERDIQVPTGSGHPLVFKRRWSSFFDVLGELGRGWTLDLPTLAERWQSVESGGQRKRRLIFEVTSPHETLSAWFNKLATVPELGNTQLLVPSRTSDAVALAPLASGGASIWVHGGGELAFDKRGRLTQERGSSGTRRYRWDGKGRLTAVEDVDGGSPSASIQFEYDPEGRIASAIGSNGAKSRYRYDGALLSDVDRPQSRLRYAYVSNRVTDVWQDSKLRMHAEYDATGRIVKRRDGASERSYTYAIGASGTTVTTAGGAGERSAFDASMRPVEEHLADGSTLKWTYAEGGSIRGTASLPGGAAWIVERRKDGREENWTAPSGAGWKIERDALARVTTMRTRDDVAARFAWLPSGQLQSVAYESSALTPSYSHGGAMTGYMMHPTGTASTSDWVKVKWDDRTGFTEVNDGTGLRAKLRDDGAGRLASVEWGKERLSVNRDGEGRVTSVQTGSGLSEQYTYAGDGSDDLVRLTRREGGRESIIEYEEGLPTMFRSFDGATTQVLYSRRPGVGLVAQRVSLPNGTILQYHYDVQGRLTEVVCGDRYRLRLTLDGDGLSTEIVVEPAQ